MTYIQSFRKQSWLLPPCIEDLIPQDHICYLVESLIESVDYTSFDIKYAGPGHPAYHPRILLKILVMGILDRVRSSRRLARCTRENIVYMYLAEKLTPDFRTISDFRKNNPDLVKEIFKHTISLAKSEGMIDLSHLATDGSKLKANAANKQMMTKQELEFVLRFIEEELDKWASQDNQEDELFKDVRGIDELPNKSRKKIQRLTKRYVEKIKKYDTLFKDKTLEKLTTAYEKLTLEGLNKVNVTDPESRFMINKKGRIECAYNVQITVDKNGFILVNDVSNDETDDKNLIPQVLQTEENLDELPEHIAWSFDNGYYSGSNIKFLDDKKINGFLPHTEKKTIHSFDKEHFTYNPSRNEYLCPAGQPVSFLKDKYDKDKKKIIRIYKGQKCTSCPHKRNCTKRKDGIRYIKSYPYEKERYAMRDKMRSDPGKEIYKLRAITVEPVFGDIKKNKGVNGFLTRGIQTVKTEFNLVCIASNMKKLWLQFQKNDNGTLDSDGW